MVRIIKLLSCCCFLNVIAQSQTINKYNCLRTGVAYQGFTTVELGFSHLVIHDKGQLGGSYCFYGAADLNMAKRNSPSYGVKVGYESVWTLFLGGIELKFLTNGYQSAGIIMPKIGLSPYGVVSISYGYNLIIPNYSFPSLYNNQFSLSVNLNHKIWKEIRSSEKMTNDIKWGICSLISHLQRLSDPSFYFFHHFRVVV